MNISNCPRCHDPIRIPESGLSPNSHAQCPWCGEEFPLAEVLNQLPPMLKILSDDGMPVIDAPYDPASGTAIAPTPVVDSSPESDVQSFELQGEQLQGDQTVMVETVAFDSATMVQDVKTNEPGFSEDLVASRPAAPARRQNKSGGGLRGIIGIVVGGLLALPIAFGILWGIGKGLGLGPFADTGGINNRRMASKPVDLSVSQDQSTTSQPMVPAVAAPEIAVFDVVDPDLADSTFDDSEVAGLTLPESESVAISDTEAATQRSGKHVEVIDLDVSDSPELVAKVAKVKVMIDAIRERKPVGKQRTTWLTAAYRTIAEASEMAEGDGPSIQQLAQSIRNSSVLDEFEVAGSDWMETSKRSNDGVLIVGTLSDRTVTLQSGSQVPIVSQIPLPPSGRVILLGKILGDKTVEAILVESL